MPERIDKKIEEYKAQKLEIKEIHVGDNLYNEILRELNDYAADVLSPGQKALDPPPFIEKVDKYKGYPLIYVSDPDSDEGADYLEIKTYYDTKNL